MAGLSKRRVGWGSDAAGLDRNRYSIILLTVRDPAPRGASLSKEDETINKYGFKTIIGRHWPDIQRKGFG